jgi:hypothetical protein
LTILIGIATIMLAGVRAHRLRWYVTEKERWISGVLHDLVFYVWLSKTKVLREI